MADTHAPYLYLHCSICSKELDARAIYACPDCGGELEVLYDYDRLDKTGLKGG